MQELCGCNARELCSWMQEHQEKPFRARQVFEWIFRQKASSFEEMTSLGQPLREQLKIHFRFPALTLLQTLCSEDGETLKFLWELPDQRRVESVLILSEGRRTVCLSCQVGCPARCAFCASGKEGLKRNLTPAEIVEQALHIDRFLREKGERVSHLVYMGMGEPFENYEAVVRSIEILSAPEGLHISPRRITISTVGVVEGIDRLAASGLRVNLVLSLHAPNQHIRKKIIPYARRYPLEEILMALDRYAKETKRDITYEYILIEGINDSAEHAEELAKLLASRQCTVNLIPYNPVTGLRLRRPERKGVEIFRSVLQRAGIPTTWRYTKGVDIAAACGQLALQQ